MGKIMLDVFGKQISIDPQAYVVDIGDFNDNVAVLTVKEQDGEVRQVPINTIKECNKSPKEFIEEFNKQNQIAINDFNRKNGKVGKGLSGYQPPEN